MKSSTAACAFGSASIWTLCSEPGKIFNCFSRSRTRVVQRPGVIDEGVVLLGRDEQRGHLERSDRFEHVDALVLAGAGEAEHAVHRRVRPGGGREHGSGAERAACEDDVRRSTCAHRADRTEHVVVDPVSSRPASSPPRRAVAAVVEGEHAVTAGREGAGVRNPEAEVRVALVGEDDPARASPENDTDQPHPVAGREPEDAAALGAGHAGLAQAQRLEAMRSGPARLSRREPRCRAPPRPRRPRRGRAQTIRFIWLSERPLDVVCPADDRVGIAPAVHACQLREEVVRVAARPLVERVELVLQLLHVGSPGAHLLEQDLRGGVLPEEDLEQERVAVGARRVTAPPRSTRGARPVPLR